MAGQSLLLRASIYRGLGDSARAALVLSEAEPLWRRLYPAGHIAFASIVSEQSLNAQMRGELQTAGDLADRALAMAEASIKAGRQAADFRPALLMRRSSIELDLRRFEEGVADSRRALTLLQRAVRAGTFSRNLGGAYLSLGRALEATGRRIEARAALRSAAQQLENTLGADHADTRAARQLFEADAKDH